jgi:hypothetical protein
MAIAVQMDFPGATLDQYDQVLEKMGLTPGGPGGAGCDLPLGGEDRRRHSRH